MSEGLVPTEEGESLPSAPLPPEPQHLILPVDPLTVEKRAHECWAEVATDMAGSVLLKVMNAREVMSLGRRPLSEALPVPR